MAVAKIGRNDVCPCGSGLKFKQCCERKREQMSRVSLFAIAGVIVAMVAVLVYNSTAERGVGSRQVWDPTLGHYHNVP
jgi:hypothetical protein